MISAMKIFLSILFFLFLSPLLPAQQRIFSAIFTPSTYSLGDELILAGDHFGEKINFPVRSIEIIDNRYDTSKQGFYPLYKNAPRQIKFIDHLSTWMTSQLNELLNIDANANRKLVLVIQRFWFGYSAQQKYSVFKQHLETSLYYKLELFSVLNENYFPLKRTEGTFTTAFDEQVTYKPLVDSMMKVLGKDIVNINFATREDAKNALSKEKFLGYISKKKDRINLKRPLVKGVYESFDDFLQQRIVGDSVDIIRYNDYYNRQAVACQLGVYIQNSLQPCNKYWGYYDGRFLFVNTGTGLFIKLTPWFNQFILADLQQIAFSKKRKTFVSQSTISTSSYNVIKDFAKVYHLFYQLDYDDGKLY
jgi:hypothetical protein